MERGSRRVRKSRRRHAPALVWSSRLFFRVCNAGVRVLDAGGYARRERELYQRLRAQHVEVEAHGTLVLPFLPGTTLGAILADGALSESDRMAAIASAADALAELHRAGFTHGDAMADNVMIDLERGAAHWFDFENAHESERAFAWRRADDLRALLTTCVVRAPCDSIADVVTLVLDAYADERVVHVLAPMLASARRRALVYHLSQAPLSFACFQEVGRHVRLRAEAGTDRTCVPAAVV